MELAPILVSVYDRRWHLEQCVEALKRNDLAKDSILYIVSDGSSKPEHDAAVAEVRAYIASISGFREVRPILMATNMGAFDSSLKANRQVLEEHGRMIRMEDDVVCSRHYLRYMNEALDLYEGDRRIFAIAAHSMPGLKMPKGYDAGVYLWSRFSPWGYGIWYDRWKLIDFYMKDYSAFAADKKAQRRFHRIAPDSGNLEDDRRGRIQAADVRLTFHMFKHDLYMVYPAHSLTKNIGHDGAGTLCGKSKRFQNQPLEDRPVVLSECLDPHRAIYRRIYWSRFSFSVHVVGRLLRVIGVFDPCYRLYRRVRGLSA